MTQWSELRLHDGGPCPVGGLQILVGDCAEHLRSLPDCSVNTCVTSPPYYWQRDYGTEGQIGHEETPEMFVAALVGVFREVRRVLREDGTLWLNLGDSYNAAGRVGHGTRQGYKQGPNRASASRADQCRPNVPGLKPKDLIGIPWRVAFALQADGWYLRQDIIWSKPNPMPESVTDRCTKAHEYIFLLSKGPRYYFDNEAIKVPASSSFAKDPRHKTGSNDRNEKSGYEQAGAQNPKGPHRLFGKSGNKERKQRPSSESIGRGAQAGSVPWEGVTANRRSVWTVTTKPFKEAHFATFPPDLIEPCVLAGAPVGGVVLDPFGGSGTTAGVAIKNGRRAILCEINPGYAEMIPARVRAIAGTKPWDQSLIQRPEGV